MSRRRADEILRSEDATDPGAASRSLRASLAAHESWARTQDRAARTEAARRAAEERFEALVDPEGRMSPEARRKAAESARKAHYRRMALNSAAVRRAKAG